MGFNSERQKSNPAEYYKFTKNDLPKGLCPWLPGLKEPSFSGLETVVPGAANGLYYSLWRDGQLKTVVHVRNEKIIEWLRLEENTADATWVCGYIAQKYYNNGEMEDFHPWADNEPAYVADISFEQWVRKFLEGMEKLIKEMKYQQS